MSRELRKWAIEQAVQTLAKPEDIISMADRLIDYVEQGSIPFREPVKPPQASPRDFSITEAQIGSMKEHAEPEDVQERGTYSTYVPPKHDDPMFEASNMSQRPPVDMLAGIDILSPSERKIVEVASSFDREFTLDEVAYVTGHKDGKSLGSQANLLSRYGFIENLGRKRWRLLTEEERAGGVALRKREKDFLQFLWGMRGQYCTVKMSEIEARSHLTNVTIINCIKVLMFAGYMKRSSHKKNGEYIFLRDPTGKEVEIVGQEKIPLEQGAAKKESAYEFEPYRRESDGVMVYPKGWSGKKEDEDFPELYDN